MGIVRNFTSTSLTPRVEFKSQDGIDTIKLFDCDGKQKGTWRFSEFDLFLAYVERYLRDEFEDFMSRSEGKTHTNSKKCCNRHCCCKACKCS